MRLWKPPHTGLSHDADVSFSLFCLMSWCLSWRSWCAAALKEAKVHHGRSGRRSVQCSTYLPRLESPSIEAFRYSFVSSFLCVLLPWVSIMISSLCAQRRKRIIARVETAVRYFWWRCSFNTIQPRLQHDIQVSSMNAAPAAADLCFSCNLTVYRGDLTNQLNSI
jgi:hypothetical protein